MQSCADTVKMWSAFRKPGSILQWLWGEMCQCGIWDPHTLNLGTENTMWKILKHVIYWTILIKICTSSLLGLIKNRHWIANGWDNKQSFDVFRRLEGTRTKEFKEITQFISVCSKKTNLSLATLNLGKSTREWSEPQTPPAQDLSPWVTGIGFQGKHKEKVEHVLILP